MPFGVCFFSFKFLSMHSKERLQANDSPGVAKGYEALLEPPPEERPLSGSCDVVIVISF